MKNENSLTIFSGAPRSGKTVALVHHAVENNLVLVCSPQSIKMLCELASDLGLVIARPITYVELVRRLRNHNRDLNVKYAVDDLLYCLKEVLPEVTAVVFEEGVLKHVSTTCLANDLPLTTLIN